MDTFSAFWSVYPRRQAKRDAEKAWAKLNPSPDLIVSIMAALDWQTKSQAWLKEDGKYVPLPATWIRGERWTDERNDRRQYARHAEDGQIRTIATWLEDCPHTPKCNHYTYCWQKQDLALWKARQAS